MKMYKVSLITALAAGALIALTPALRAQDKPDRPEGGPRQGQAGGMAKERLARLAEELNLTADQKTKVEAAMKAQAETLRGLRDATPDDRREKIQAARKELDTKIKEILTAEQYTKWEKIREQRGPGGSRRGGPGGPGGPAGEKPEKN